jgi:hypothetical protein
MLRIVKGCVTSYRTIFNTLQRRQAPGRSFHQACFAFMGSPWIEPISRRAHAPAVSSPDTTFIPERFMERNIRDIINLYNPDDALDHAWTIPSPWYFDRSIEHLEREGVFAKTWQVPGRVDQVRENGNFFTADVAGEPIVVARGEDGQLRAFYQPEG